MFEFTKDWFSHHERSWRWLFSQLQWQTDKASVVVEIGSFEGRSTVWTLQNLFRNAESRIYCIDSWAGGVEHADVSFPNVLDRFKNNVAATGKADQVEIRQGLSTPELMKLCLEGVQADFLYVDGSHQAADVLADLVIGFELVRPGGLILCDDYVWRMEKDENVDLLNNPKLAVDNFVNTYRRKLRLVHGLPLVQLAVVKL